jgi:hypothetical protein
MVAPVGVNVTVNANMDHCCPRRVRLSCCCKVDDDVDERVQKVSQSNIERNDDSDDET